MESDIKLSEAFRSEEYLSTINKYLLETNTKVKNLQFLD